MLISLQDKELREILDYLMRFNDWPECTCADKWCPIMNRKTKDRISDRINMINMMFY